MQKHDPPSDWYLDMMTPLSLAFASNCSTASMAALAEKKCRNCVSIKPVSASMKIQPPRNIWMDLLLCTILFVLNNLTFEFASSYRAFKMINKDPLSWLQFLGWQYSRPFLNDSCLFSGDQLICLFSKLTHVRFSRVIRWNICKWAKWCRKLFWLCLRTCSTGNVSY